MPRKIGNVDRSVLVNAALPAATKTYTVISHSYAINTILKELNDNGFNVESEEYKCTTDAKVAHGTFVISYDGDEDLGLTYSFSNSYDKTQRFRSAVGAHIYENGSYMISNINEWKRKHTGTADDETEELIKGHIQNAHHYFNQLQQDKNSMREITISRSEFGAVIGELYINGFLESNQIGLLGKEYDNPTYTYTDGNTNLWTCYKHIANALRQSHPSKWLSQQAAVHLFFVTKYDLVQFDVDETTDENQVDDTLSSQESTETSNEPSVSEIHDDVEDLPTLPGFNAAPAIESEEEPEVKDCNELTLEDAIEQANDAQPYQNMEPSQEEKDQMMEAYNEDVEAGEYPNATPVKDLDAEEDEDWDKLEEAGVIAEVIEEPKHSIPGTEGGHQFIPDNKADEEADMIKTEEAIKEKIAEDEAAVAEVCDEAPFESVTPTNIPSETTVNDPDMLFEKADYPDVNYDDTIEVDGSFYQIINEVLLEGVSYWAAKELTLTEEATEMPDIAPPTPIEVLDDVEPTTESTEVVVDQVSSNQNDSIRNSIANELEEIYGEVHEFTYEQAGNQYNITLNTGETIVLSAAYIESIS